MARMTKTTVPCCQSNNSKGVGAWGTAVRVAIALEDGVKDPERRIVYNGTVLFDLTITFLVVKSFTDKSNGSNSIEHQLSVVKQRTKMRL
jgi:formate-dependent phosphoribosylglycinamide formyltransferase (GAR transformylase)